MKIKKNINLNLGDNHFKQNEAKCQKSVICRLHNQECDLICLTDGKNICYNCALFGQHKGHQVQTCQIFTKKLLQHQKQIFNIAKSINQTKQQKSKFLQLKQLLKKEQITKIDKIKETFRSLIVEIKIKQKQCIRKLQKEYNQIESTLKKQEEKLYKKLQKQEQNTIWFDSLNKLNRQPNQNKKQDFFQCSQMFLTDQKRSSFLQIGRKIQSQHKKSFQKLQKEMRLLINSIGLSFQSPSYKSIFIQNWCQISKRKIAQQQHQSEYQQQDFQFYLLSSVKSFQDFQQKKGTFKQQKLKQYQDEQCLLNSLRIEEVEQTVKNDAQKVSVIENVSFTVLQQVNTMNSTNIKANQKQKQKQKANKKIMQKKLQMNE